MKVKELIKALQSMNPEDEIVLHHLYTSPPVIMKTIRVFEWKGRVMLDGFNQEKSSGS